MTSLRRHRDSKPGREPGPTLRSARTRAVTLGLGASLLAIWALVAACSVNPATGERQISLIGESQEIQMGKASDQEIVQSLGVVPDDELQAYVDRIGQRLAATSERPDLPWTFRVVDDPVVNAFALPGGYIYVTRGILAHLDNEAELAGVLGHEIGHVTARHSVERLSRAQLTQIGLGIGMAVSEDVARFGDLAQQGLGLLFLKFGRDDERQSDDLGLRYLQRAGYDPREMSGVFETLERVSAAQGGDRIPGWLSTHPAPENRVGRIDARLPATVSPNARVGREDYLRRLDGLAFGTDPREGFFQDGVFYHPGLEFRLEFPEGWETSNQKTSVSAVSPQRDAVVTLTLAQGSTVHEAARELFEQSGVERGREADLRFGGRPAVAYELYASTQQGELRGIAAFLEHDGRIFRLLGYGPADRFGDRERQVERSLESFDRVTDRRILEVEPRRLDILELPRAMTLEEVAKDYPSTVDLDTLAVVNGLESPRVRISAGRLVKRVVGGWLPD